MNERARGTAPGYILVAAKKGAGQDGPMIVDNLGRPVWFSKDRYATDFKVQRYRAGARLYKGGQARMKGP